MAIDTTSTPKQTGLPPLIPREVLFGNPEKVQPQISPDGKRISYLAPKEGVLNVFVGPSDGSEPAKPVTKDTDRGIRFHGWAHNNRHLLYIQDQGGDENWRIYTVDLETNEVKDVTPFAKVQGRIIKLDRDRPNEALVGINKDNPQLHDVYHLDLITGELELVEKNPGFLGWEIAKDFEVKGAVTMNPDGSVATFIRKQKGGEFEPFITFTSEDGLSSGIVGFTNDGKAVWYLSPAGAEGTRLIKRDLESGEEKVVVEDPEGYDVGVALFDDRTGDVQIASVLKDRQQLVVLDESLRSDIETVKKVQPDAEVNIVDRDHADKTWLVSFNADNGPINYYSFDRTTKKATFLFAHRPELTKYELAKMEPFSFKAGDGLTVHGYITFPVGLEKKNLPAVLNVHGGPWTRDVWGFNAEAQWFASRGYACIQVNYRGSTGYGKKFLNAANKEWAGKMHDDLIDAVEYTISQGWVDRNRVGIYGGSYGGYAALVGATFTPDVFKCAVDIVGPSNLNTLIRSIPEYWKPMIALFHQRTGNPDTEEDFLWSRSPLSRVDKIKIPMLIVQGANDPRVTQQEAEQIVAAMKEKNIPHEYLLFPDEGHGFAKPENRLKFYGEAEPFLAEHLGGRSQG